MVNKIPSTKMPSKTPEDDDFKSQYSGGVNQYGTKGAQSPDQFQSYMNDGVTTPAAGDAQNQSPMEMMANQQNETFGAPTAKDASSQDGAAPENFGPPGITQTSEGSGAQNSSFGAPNFEQPPKATGSKTNDSNSANSSSGNNTPFQVGAPVGETSPTSATAQNAQSSQGTDSTGAKKKKSYQTVEKMEVRSMMQNAIRDMKVKDPDPSAWSQ